MTKNLKPILFWSGVLLLIVVGSVLMVRSSNTPGKYDGFAQCIKDKGATFYGAFWCPHCRTQKNLFGKSSKLLPYVECSTPDGNSQLAVCTEKGVSSYPTWIFSDGTVKNGELSLNELADITSCQLPQ